MPEGMVKAIQTDTMGMVNSIWICILSVAAVEGTDFIWYQDCKKAVRPEKMGTSSSMLKAKLGCSARFMPRKL